MCRDAVRKAEAQLKLKSTSGIKNYKKSVLQVRKQAETAQCYLLLNRRGELVASNVERQRFSALGSHLFAGAVEPQALE